MGKKKKELKLPVPPRLPGTRHIVIADEMFGDLELVYAIPRDDEPWGAYAPLKGTLWEPCIAQVSGIVFSQALLADTKALRKQLGRPPRIDARRLPDEMAFCAKAFDGTCAMATAFCRPGTGRLPQCYVAPGLDPEVALVAASVALEWKENRYTAVVLGEGFIL